MRLPVKTLQEIIGRPAREFIGRGRQRALGRIAVQTPALIFPVHRDLMDEPFAGMVRDISAETIGVSSPRAMMPSMGLVVCLSQADGQPLAIQCIVTRCSGLRAGQYVVGARFVRMLDPQSFHLTTLSAG